MFKIQLIEQPEAQLSAVSIKLVLLVVAFLFVSYRTLSLMIIMWTDHGYYSHAFLVPFISLYLVWHKRQELHNIPIRPNISEGLALTLIGGLALLSGTISGVTTLQLISVIIIIAGLVWMLFGTGHLYALALPLTYLVFIVPIFDGILEKIYWPYQLGSTAIAVLLLKAVQMPVSQNLQYLQLPHITLEVTKACSGVNSLLSNVAVGIPLAYVTQREWWKRIMLVIFAAIIGILTNGMRIAFIGIWTYFSDKAIEGARHILLGLFISAIGFSFLFVAAWAMGRIPSADSKKSLETRMVKMKGVFHQANKFNIAWLTGMIVLSGLGGFLLFYSPKPQPLKMPINELPLIIGGWNGQDVSAQVIPVKPQGADSELVRVYRNASGHEVRLYIGYFESQKQGKTLVSDTLQNIYETSKEVKVSMQDAHRFVSVNEAIRQTGGKNHFISYCFALNGRIVADRYKARLLTAFDGFVHGRTNGAVIMILSDGKGPAESGQDRDDAIDFLQQMLPFWDHIS
jgi:EpsI family protein